MPCSSVDKLIRELDMCIESSKPSKFLESRFAGLISVAAVAAYELIIKNALVDFCSTRDLLFGKYVENVYGRKRGRISTKDLKESHLSLLGAHFVSNFGEGLEKLSLQALTSGRMDPISNYDGLITCRHKFVHEEEVTLLYNEAKNNFQDGKLVVSVFQKVLTNNSNNP